MHVGLLLLVSLSSGAVDRPMDQGELIELMLKKEPKLLSASGQPVRAGVSLQLSGGAGHSEERYTGGGSFALTGGAVSVPVSSASWIDVRVGARFGRQSYVTLQPDIDGGGSQRPQVAEQRFDGQLDFTYDFATLTSAAESFSFRVGAGPRGLFLQNEITAARRYGAGGLARLAFKANGLLTFGVQGGGGYYFDGTRQTLSALGVPQWSAEWGASIGVPMSGDTFSLELAYRGDLLALGFDHRVAHFAVLALHVRL